MTTENHCNFPGCWVNIGASSWACVHHWLLIPPELRTNLWESFGDPVKYTKACAAAKKWAENYRDAK